MTDERRWDGDESGTGIRDAAEWQASVDQFRAAIASGLWVTEDPAAHLLPSLRDAVADAKCELVHSEVVDGVLGLDVVVSGVGRRGARQIAMAILGSVAEEASFVREVQPGLFECLTRTIATHEFAPHGHAIRLHVTTTGEKIGPR